MSSLLLAYSHLTNTLTYLLTYFLGDFHGELHYITLEVYL